MQPSGNRPTAPAMALVAADAVTVPGALPRVAPRAIPRAIVVGDDPLVRQGLITRLAGSSAGTAVGEAVPADDISAAVMRNAANVVLWDLGPGPIRDDLSFSSSVPVVALAPASTPTRDLIRAGAAGVLVRDVEPAALVSALDTVLHGLTVTDPRLPAQADVPRPAGPPPSQPRPELTPRETQVLELLAAGLSNKQIAAELGISTHTVKFHVNAILYKLDAQTRTEAVVKALQHGFVLL